MFLVMLSLNWIHAIIVVLRSFSMKSFVSEDSNISSYIHGNIIAQMHSSMNSLKDSWMLVLFCGYLSMNQQSLSRVGFEPTLSHMN